VKANKGASGVDGRSIEDFEADLSERSGPNQAARPLIYDVKFLGACRGGPRMLPGRKLPTGESRIRRKIAHALTLFAVSLCLATTPAYGGTQAPAAPQFKVLAFYNGTFDAAHISFVNQANQWFPQTAAQNNFSYTSTNNWDLLNSIDATQHQVVMFLDDLPHNAAQQAGFQRYMQNGGAWFGFHVAAFDTDPSTWDWYHNQFLGTGAFVSNTWGPTTAVLRVENPATLRLPSTFTSSVSERYSWANDLRNNPNIKILASVDA
jgi:hypothetical protein